MARLRYTDQVADTLQTLAGDTARAALFNSVRSAVRLVRDHPGWSDARQRAFSGGWFGVSVRAGHDDWIVVWRPDPDADDTVILLYIGPGPSARLGDL